MVVLSGKTLRNTQLRYLVKVTFAWARMTIWKNCRKIPRSVSIELMMGVTGKKLMWAALAAAKFPPLNRYNLEQLQCRAEQQLERIEPERI